MEDMASGMVIRMEFTDIQVMAIPMEVSMVLSDVRGGFDDKYFH